MANLNWNQKLCVETYPLTLLLTLFFGFTEDKTVTYHNDFIQIKNVYKAYSSFDEAQTEGRMLNYLLSAAGYEEYDYLIRGTCGQYESNWYCED